MADEGFLDGTTQLSRTPPAVTETSATFGEIQGEGERDANEEMKHSLSARNY
jgi:hypothetical protein